MKTVFITNYMTHHQKPFCDAMFEALGKDFTLIETEKMEAERVKMGWQSERLPYVIRAWETESSQAESALQNAEAVILGACPEKWYHAAAQSNAKIVFLYGERIFKKGGYQRFGPGARRYREKIRRMAQAKNTYMLCASAYLANDLAQLGLLKGRWLKWGYFPPETEYPEPEAVIAAKRPASILWAGRMIDWKHPEDALHLAEQLKKDGVSFTLDFAGDGAMREQIERAILEKGLGDCVQVLGFMPPEDVRRRMEAADIYLVTSDRFEGWGAVLNEAMNAGCAVVASREIGAAPFLIQDGENGRLYNRKKKNDLHRIVWELLSDADKKHKMQQNAYRTIACEWNGKNAAARLLEAAEKLAANESTGFEGGPCSKARRCRS